MKDDSQLKSSILPILAIVKHDVAFVMIHGHSIIKWLEFEFLME